MTKQDFQAIADSLKLARSSVDFNPEARFGVTLAAAELALVCLRANQRFNSKLFFEACGISNGEANDALVWLEDHAALRPVRIPEALQ